MQGAVEREQVHRPVGPVIEEDADARGIDAIAVEAILDRSGALFEGRTLEEAADAEEGPDAVPLVGFEASPQESEARGQRPVLPGLRRVEAAGFAFQDRQLMKRIVAALRAVPAARRRRHHLVFGDDLPHSDRGEHGPFALSILRRHRIRVAVERRQRQGSGRRRPQPSGRERPGRQGQERGTILGPTRRARPRRAADRTFLIALARILPRGG